MSHTEGFFKKLSDHLTHRSQEVAKRTKEEEESDSEAPPDSSAAPEVTKLQKRVSQLEEALAETADELEKAATQVEMESNRVEERDDLLVRLQSEMVTEHETEERNFKALLRAKDAEIENLKQRLDSSSSGGSVVGGELRRDFEDSRKRQSNSSTVADEGYYAEHEQAMDAASEHAQNWLERRREPVWCMCCVTEAEKEEVVPSTHEPPPVGFELWDPIFRS